VTAAALDLTALERALSDWHVLGLQVVVVRRSEVLVAGGFGVQGVDDPTPVSGRSLFDHGSCGKAYTALLASLLHDDGLLDLDAPVRLLVPELALPDEDLAERVTLRDLLSHRSGLSRNDLAWILNGAWDRAELLRRLAHLPATGPLRGQWAYSNFGFALAGEAIGRAAGATWEDLLEKRILAPLGMAAASGRPGGATPDRAAGHVLTDRRVVPTPHRELLGPAPAGQLVASADDAARWLLLHAGEPLLPRPAVERTHQVQMDMGQPHPLPEMELDGYAMGWVAGRYRGRRMLTHSGGIDGFLTQTLVLPDDALGVLVSANQHMSGLPMAAMLTLADQLLGEAEDDWLTRLRTPAAEAKPEPPRADTARLSGRWTHPGYGELEIGAAGTARLGSGELAVRQSETGLQLYYAPLALDVDLAVEEDALLLSLDTGSPPTRFVRA
jgi:CubicO group peptidase (beta-lactamase class C family)